MVELSVLIPILIFTFLIFAGRLIIIVCVLPHTSVQLRTLVIGPGKGFMIWDTSFHGGGGIFEYYI
jgi:hypothetical protein